MLSVLSLIFYGIWLCAKTNNDDMKVLYTLYSVIRRVSPSCCMCTEVVDGLQRQNYSTWCCSFHSSCYSRFEMSRDR